MFSALFLLAQALLMMEKLLRLVSSMGVGASRIRSTVWLLIFLISLMPET